MRDLLIILALAGCHSSTAVRSPAPVARAAAPSTPVRQDFDLARPTPVLAETISTGHDACEQRQRNPITFLAEEATPCYRDGHATPRLPVRSINVPVMLAETPAISH